MRKGIEEKKIKRKKVKKGGEEELKEKERRKNTCTYTSNLLYLVIEEIITHVSSLLKSPHRLLAYSK